jgi:hypothetical protein
VSGNDFSLLQDSSPLLRPRPPKNWRPIRSRWSDSAEKRVLPLH